MKEHSTHPMRIQINDQQKRVLECKIEDCKVIQTNYKRKNHSEVTGI